ncbi:MAG TPA: hypothetical protein VFK05_12445 [Polyangiaceae bacterium]|nr:hypothetical protein [Polyangiaceae bacterium]
MAQSLSLKDARMSAQTTLVQVAAEAGCSIGLVQKYELSPAAVTDPRKRARLDAIYQRFPRTVAA